MGAVEFPANTARFLAKLGIIIMEEGCAALTQKESGAGSAGLLANLTADLNGLATTLGEEAHLSTAVAKH